MHDTEKALYCYENAIRHSPYNIKALTQAASICRMREQYPKVYLPTINTLYPCTPHRTTFPKCAASILITLHHLHYSRMLPLSFQLLSPFSNTLTTSTKLHLFTSSHIIVPLHTPHHMQHHQSHDTPLCLSLRFILIYDTCVSNIH